ncbi:MAG: hypothetical protein DBX39_04635 [Bacillota bacterium]|nr:MAG: hypothetical protein DBX39_04635 [Bacillota bacterium]
MNGEFADGQRKLTTVCAAERDGRSAMSHCWKQGYGVECRQHKLTAVCAVAQVSRSAFIGKQFSPDFV